MRLPAALIGIVLVLPAARPANGGALADSVTVSASDELVASRRLNRIVLENDGTWLRMRIPLDVPWKHFTLSDPPRIVVDLDQTLSVLPKSPGTYSVRLDRGPVAVLRTSQLALSSKEKKVRVVCELTRMVAYQARREGDAITILMPDPVERSPRLFVLGPNGLSASEDASAPARTLREALAAVVGADNLIETPERPVDPPPSRAASGSSRASGAAPGPPSTPPSQTGIASGARAKTGSPSTSNAGASSSTPSPGAQASSPAGIEEERALSREVGAASLSPAAAVHEHAARRLLRAAVQAFRSGDERKAAGLTERARRFYAGTPAAGQAGLLLREIRILGGSPEEAERIEQVADRPDSSALPLALFLELAHRHRAASNLMALDRLLRQWGPAYGPVPELSQLHLSLARAYETARERDLARQHLEQIPPGDPCEAPALLLLARISDEEGDKEKALELYERASTLPGRSSPLRGLARTADLQFQTGRVREALASYEKLLAGDPPSDEQSWAVYQSGNCHLLLGEADSARVRFKTVTERWPSSFWASFAKDRLEELKWRERLSNKADANPGP